VSVEIKDILGFWNIKNVELIQKLGEGTVVYIVETEQGTIVLKRHKISLPEKYIQGNIRAHEFLGNKLKIAPQIYYRPDGTAFWKSDTHYYYLMEFIQGIHVQETAHDEWLLGEATAKLHQLTGYNFPCELDANEQIRTIKTWYSDRKWKPELDMLMDSLPDFNSYSQCFIHTDIGPHNAIVRNGAIVFIDLDGAGIGSKYLDIGYPFIAQFVAYNKKSGETYYKFDAAKAFLEGYCSVSKLTKAEYDLIWHGAVLRHIYEMQYYGEEAVEPLWHILNFGLQQKDNLLQIVNCIV
jgi:Ser/Thr protein kinase RdoA (MazF antagonist)